MAYRAVGPQSLPHFGQVQGPMPLVNLHGVSSAERNMRPPLASKVDKFAFSASAATGAGTLCPDFRALVSPEVERQERPAYLLLRSHQQLDRFGRRDGGPETHRRIQDTGGLAGFERAARRIRKDAAQAGGLARQNIERDTVTGHRGGIDPGQGILDREV